MSDDRIGTASIAVTVESSGVDAGLNRMEASVQRTGRTLQTLGQTGSAAVDSIGTGAPAAAGRLDAATRQIQNSIQRVTAATEAGERNTRSYFEALAGQRGANLDTLRPYLDQLEQVRQRQDAAAQAALRNGAAFQNNSQSAAQLAANLRNVPAQLTDIVAGIQGGQQPLTILLQQGGQLRDMFGGVGAAARALGGYLVSLVNPFTVTAAAVGVLTVAYSQGAQEAQEYNKAIITTGNAAGVTSDQLATMAKHASDVAGTQAQNAEVLTKLVGTGQVAANQLERFSTIAIQSQKLLGTSVDDTVKAFADLGKDPLEATKRLNEQLNYLTNDTYLQIKALQEQGSTLQAGKVAQKAFADAQAEVNKKILDSMPPLKRGWIEVQDAAKGAWDAMLNIGRKDTLEEQIAAAIEDLKNAKKQLSQVDLSFVGDSQDKAEEKKRLQAIADEKQRQVDRLQNIQKVGEMQADYDAKKIAANKALRTFEDQDIQYLTTAQKIQKEMGEAVKLGNQAAVPGEDPAVTEDRIQKRIKAIRQTYADYFNQTIEGQIAAVQRLGAAQQEAAKQAFIPIQANQDAGLNKSLQQQFKYIDDKADADVKQLQNDKDLLQKQLALEAQKTVAIDGTFDHEQKLATLRASISDKDAQIATRRKQQEADIYVTDTKNTQELTKEYNDLLDSRQADLDSLNDQIKAQGIQNEMIGLSGKALQDFKTQLVEEKAARLESQAALLASIPERRQEYQQLLDSAQALRKLNAAQIQGENKSQLFQQYDSLFNSIDKAAEDAFTHIGDSGESVFKRLEDSLKSGLLDLLYQMTVKQFILNVKANLSGDATGSLSNFLAASSGNSGSGLGLLGSASSLFTVGKTIYSGFSAGVAGSLGTQIANLGSVFGSQAVSAFGAGMQGGLTGAMAAAGPGATATSASAAGAGSSAAAAIPIIGWIIAGMSAANGFMKEGFTPNNGTLNPIGQAIGLPTNFEDKSLQWLGVGSSLANILSGAAINTKLFGRADPVIESQGLEGTINSSGITADQYANILEKGGWFRSDKRYTNTAPLDSTSDANFDTTIQAMIASVKGFGKAIGEQSTQIDGYTKSFKLQLTGDATKDNDLIAGLFSDVGNELSTLLVPSIAKLEKDGETASSALQRLAGDYVTMNNALGAIGLQFNAVGVSSLDMRESLLTLSGGLDNFVSQADFFSQNFLTDTERNAAVTKQLDAAFADLGVTSIPKTRDQFKALVDSLDLTTDGGQKMYAGLMSLEQAFAAVTPQIDEAALALSQQKEQHQLDIQLMDALGQSEKSLSTQRSDALDALQTDQARITQAQIYAAQDAKKIYDAVVSSADSALSRLSTSINAQKQTLNDAYNAQADAIRTATQSQVDTAQKSLQAAQTQASAIQTVFSSLDSALSSTKIESDAADLARRRAAQTALAQALLNPSGLANNKSVTDAVSTITSQSNTRFFGTYEDYARDQARTNNTLVALRNVAGTQVDAAQQMVDSLQDAIDAIQKSGEDQLAQLQKNNQDQLNALDQQLADDTAQLDALKGIDNSVLSLKDAIAAFTAAVTAVKSTPDPTNPNTPAGTADPIEGLYESLLGRQGEEAGLKFWHDALANGVSLDTITADFLNSDEYKKRKLNGFAVGTNFVPYDQTANIHYGERIIPAADNAQLMALMARATDPSQNSSALAAEVARLRGVVEKLQGSLDAIATNTGTAAGALTDAQNGRPLNVKVKS